MKRRTILSSAAASALAMTAGGRLARALVAPTRKPTGSELPFARSDGATTVLTGARIHVGDGTTIDAGTVVVRGTTITAVGPASVAGSAGGDATRVDLAGQWLTPGFIAAATPLGLVEIGAESSTVDSQRADDDPIRAGYDASIAIHADSPLLAVQAIDGVTTAAVTPVGGLVSGQVAWIDLLTDAPRDIVARPRIAVHAHLGQTWKGSRAAAFARLQEALDDAQVYDRTRAAYDRRQSRDLVAHPRDLQALVPVLAGRIPLVASADRVEDLLALLDLAARRRLRLTIVGAAQGWKIADALAKAGVTVIVQPSENLPGAFDRLGARLDNAAKLHAAGVRVGIGVLDEAHNVRNVAQETGIAIANGLPASAAVAAVSANIATAYGMDDHYGTIAVGKVANLVAWPGDPFELSNVPNQVWIRGAAIAMRSRQTELLDRYRDLSRVQRGRSHP